MLIDIITTMRNKVGPDLSLILGDLEQKEGKECADVFLLYCYSVNVSEICRMCTISRFKVSKYIRLSTEFIRSIIKEGDMDVEEVLY